MKNDSRLEAWVEQHRELLLISSVLPLGKAYSVVESFERKRNAPDPAAHSARVSRVAREVKQYADKRAREGAAAVGPLRTDRKPNASLNTRATDKSRASKVQMGDLRAILGVNRERGTVRTSTTSSTCAACSNATKSSSGRVECPMVKNVRAASGLEGGVPDRSAVAALAFNGTITSRRKTSSSSGTGHLQPRQRRAPAAPNEAPGTERPS